MSLMYSFIRRSPLIACAIILSGAAYATSVPRLSFEDLADQAELVVSGQVTRSWSDWDSAHKFIWTHYSLAVASSGKGSPASTVVISEPGGVVGDRGMSVAGSVLYQPGDTVVAFLSRMPNGYLRTTGWGQGKYRLDAQGVIHADASPGGMETADSRSATSGLSLRSLDGMSFTELKTRIAARTRALQQNPRQGAAR